MKLYVINGPSLNMLGVREPEVYGNETYDDLVAFVNNTCIQMGIEVECFQTNHEGSIIDIIHRAYDDADGIVLNAGAYTHTSIAIMDALKSVNIPTVEVHLTNIYERETFRHSSYISMAAEQTIVGKGLEGYRQAILFLQARMKNA
jgi:3-dehydroquinate dehydratase-2